MNDREKIRLIHAAMLLDEADNLKYSSVFVPNPVIDRLTLERRARNLLRESTDPRVSGLVWQIEEAQTSGLGHADAIRVLLEVVEERTR